PRAMGKYLGGFDPSIKMEDMPLKSSMDGRTFYPKPEDTPAQRFLDREGGDVDKALRRARDMQSGRAASPDTRETLADIIKGLEEIKSKPPILFHSFPLTYAVKAKVMEEGQPMFAKLGGRETDERADAVKRPSSSERITEAANKYGDQVFTGMNHGEAYAAAVEAIGEDRVKE